MFGARQYGNGWDRFYSEVLSWKANKISEWLNLSTVDSLNFENELDYLDWMLLLCYEECRANILQEISASVFCGSKGSNMSVKSVRNGNCENMFCIEMNVISTGTSSYEALRPGCIFQMSSNINVNSISSGDSANNNTTSHLKLNTASDVTYMAVIYQSDRQVAVHRVGDKLTMLVFEPQHSRLESAFRCGAKWKAVNCGNIINFQRIAAVCMDRPKATFLHKLIDINKTTNEFTSSVPSFPVLDRVALTRALHPTTTLSSDYGRVSGGGSVSSAELHRVDESVQYNDVTQERVSHRFFDDSDSERGGAASSTASSTGNSIDALLREVAADHAASEEMLQCGAQTVNNEEELSGDCGFVIDRRPDPDLVSRLMLEPLGARAGTMRGGVSCNVGPRRNSSTTSASSTATTLIKTPFLGGISRTQSSLGGAVPPPNHGSSVKTTRLVSEVSRLLRDSVTVSEGDLFLSAGAVDGVGQQGSAPLCAVNRAMLQILSHAISQCAAGEVHKSEQGVDSRQLVATLISMVDSVACDSDTEIRTAIAAYHEHVRQSEKSSRVLDWHSTTATEVQQAADSHKTPHNESEVQNAEFSIDKIVALLRGSQAQSESEIVIPVPFIVDRDGAPCAATKVAVPLISECPTVIDLCESELLPETKPKFKTSAESKTAVLRYLEGAAEGSRAVVAALNSSQVNALHHCLSGMLRAKETANGDDEQEEDFIALPSNGRQHRQASPHTAALKQKCADDAKERGFSVNTGGLYLVQGPPGCGKTHLLSALLHVCGAIRLRVLVCAPSNKAVCVALEKFIVSGGGRLGVRMAMVGVEDKLDSCATSELEIQSRISGGFEKKTGSVFARAQQSLSTGDSSFAASVSALVDPQHISDLFAATFGKRVQSAVTALRTELSVFAGGGNEEVFYWADALRSIEALTNGFVAMVQNVVERIPYFVQTVASAHHDLVLSQLAALVTQLSQCTAPKHRKSPSTPVRDSNEIAVDDAPPGKKQKHSRSNASSISSSASNGSGSSKASKAKKAAPALGEGPVVDAEDQLSVMQFNQSLLATFASLPSNTKTSTVPVSKPAALSEAQRLSITNALSEVCSSLTVLANTYGESSAALQIADEYVQTAVFVFCTLSSAGNFSVSRNFTRIDLLVVDEAAQVFEPELLVPVSLCPLNLLMVGDPMQLPATVISQQIQRLGHGQSAMQRLMHRPKPYPYCLLDTQYRMHPNIAAFSCAHFYEGLVRNAKQVTRRPNLLADCRRRLEAESASSVAPSGFQLPDTIPGWLVGNYSFLDVSGSEQKVARLGHSLENLQEAQLISRLVRYLRDVWHLDVRRQVCVITFYAAQVQCIRERLSREGLGAEKVRVLSVDSFQGSECDCVILSFVRSNPHSAVGFVKDFQRLNVALTRARRLMVSVGSASTLQSVSSAVDEGADVAQGGGVASLPSVLQSGRSLSAMVADLRTRNRLFSGLEVLRDISAALDSISL